LVRDVQEIDAGPELEQLAGDVRRRAVARRGEGQLARLRLRGGDELPHALDRHRGVYGDELWNAHDERYRGEIALDVVVELVEQRIDRVRGQREEKRVAVGRRARHFRRAHRAACAAASFDQDRLPEAFRDTVLHEA